MLGGGRRISALVGAVLAAGCGGSANGSNGVNAADQGGSAGASAGSGGSAAGSGGSAAGTGGTAGGGGRAGSAGSAGDAPLVPLVTGHVWTFEFSPINPDMPMTDVCDAPSNVVGDVQTVAGITGLHYESYCSQYDAIITGSGDSLTAHPILSLEPPMLSGPNEFIHSPVVDGESWLAGSTMMTWAEVPGEITVPAGTFSNCWQRVGFDVATLTYCRGAGLVAGTLMTGNWTMALVSKNF